MAKITDTVILDAAEIVIYVLLLPLVVFLGIRHGKKYALGYIYLGIFSILRITSDGLAIANRNSTDEKTIIITQALGSAGLSPLLLVLAALAYEAHQYHIKSASSLSDEQDLLPRLKGLQGAFHVLSAGGMGLIVYAAQKAGNVKNEHDTHLWENLRKLGVIMMLLAAFAELAYSVYVFFSVRRSRKPSKALHLTTFTTCVSIGGIFVCIRAIYSVVYTFDDNPNINPLTGGFGVKLMFVVLDQFLAVSGMVIGAWVTRNIKRAAAYGPIPRPAPIGGNVDGDCTLPLADQGYANYSRGPNQGY